MHRVAPAAPAPHVPRLVRWQRLGLFTSGALLLLSGLVWLAVHYSVGAGAGELPHALEAWSLRLHGLAAFAGLFVLGALAAAHVPHGWRMSRRRRWSAQRRSGALLCGVAALLALSGYLLFYFAPEAIRPALGWAHTGLGVAMGLLLASHRRGLHGSAAARAQSHRL
jgi:hypothetical protein